MTPERRHRMSHGPHEMDSCWHCQRARAICSSKRSFPSQFIAELSCLEGNVSREWQGRLFMEYHCDWCHVWHMRTAEPRDAKRLRRRRRLFEMCLTA